MKKGKKGLSEIVTTLLFVLLALGAVILVWALVRPILTRSGEQITASQECMNLDLQATQCAYNTTVTGKNNATVLYKRGAQAITSNFTKVNLVFTATDGTTITVVSTNVPTILQTVSFTTPGVGLAKVPTKVSAIATLKNAAGTETTCEVAGAPSVSCV